MTLRVSGEGGVESRADFADHAADGAWKFQAEFSSCESCQSKIRMVHKLPDTIHFIHGESNPISIALKRYGKVRLKRVPILPVE
jgi:hypothetical protein